MKNLSSIILTMISTILLLACGGSDDNNVEGNTYRLAVTLPALKADTVVVLTDLNTAVSSIECDENWLKVENLPYGKGSPSVHLTAENNESTKPRNCVVKVVASSSDEMILQVTQLGQSLTDIDDVHNMKTDQPAASRKQ